MAKGTVHITSGPAAQRPDPTASQILHAQLDQWGIGSLYRDALTFLQQGLSMEAVLLQLQATDTYKKRFSGNEDRRKAGLRELAPAEYVDLETQYRSIMRTFGLPAGFYDTNDDLRKFIGNDVSASELQDRAQLAQTVWLSNDTNTRSAYKQLYGIDDGTAIASILDPTVAEPIVRRKVMAAQIGGQALANGLAAPTAARAEQFANLGVTQSDAQKAYGDIGQAAASDAAIAARFGNTFGQSDQEDARLVGLASAQRKLRTLQGSERSLFSGRAGATSQSLSQNAAGSY